MATSLNFNLLQNTGDNLIAIFVNASLIFYNVFSIYGIMFFGNEVLLESGKLSYCIYQSNWISRAQSIKKFIMAFTELVRNPIKVSVLKLYPLTLVTFGQVSKLLNTRYDDIRKLLLNVLSDYSRGLQHV